MEVIHLHNENIATLDATIPRLGIKIRTLWGTKECRDFLIELLADSRDGTRQGFSPEIASLIIRLLQDHDDSYPQFDDSNQVIATFSDHSRVLLNVTRLDSEINTVVDFAKWTLCCIVFVEVVKAAIKYWS